MVIEVRQSYSQYNSPSCAHAMIPTFVCVLKTPFRTFSGQFQRGQELRAKLRRNSDTKLGTMRVLKSLLKIESVALGDTMTTAGIAKKVCAIPVRLAFCQI